MARNLTEAEIREVVSQVLNQVSTVPTAAFDSTQYAGKRFAHRLYGYARVCSGVAQKIGSRWL